MHKPSLDVVSLAMAVYMGVLSGDCCVLQKLQVQIRSL